MWVPPFGNLRVKGCLLLTAAYRSLPSHPLCALSSLTIKFTHEQQTKFQISNFRFEIDLLQRNFTSLFTLLYCACTVKLAFCVSFYLTSHLKISDLKFQI